MLLLATGTSEIPSGTCEILFNLEVALLCCQWESYAWCQQPKSKQNTQWADRWVGSDCLTTLTAQNKDMWYLSDPRNTAGTHNRNLYRLRNRGECYTQSHQWIWSKTDCFGGRDLEEWLHTLTHPDSQVLSLPVKVLPQHVIGNSSLHLQISLYIDESSQ